MSRSSISALGSVLRQQLGNIAAWVHGRTARIDSELLCERPLSTPIKHATSKRERKPSKESLQSASSCDCDYFVPLSDAYHLKPPECNVPERDMY